MIPTKIDKVIEFGEDIQRAACNIRDASLAVNVAFFSNPTQLLFQIPIAMSPAAQAFIEAFKAEQEAEIERLKKELEEL